MAVRSGAAVLSRGDARRPQHRRLLLTALASGRAGLREVLSRLWLRVGGGVVDCRCGWLMLLGTMYVAFRWLTVQYGFPLGYLLAFRLYWGVWCVAVPVAVPLSAITARTTRHRDAARGVVASRGPVGLRVPAAHCFHQCDGGRRVSVVGLVTGTEEGSVPDSRPFNKPFITLWVANRLCPQHS